MVLDQQLSPDAVGSGRAGFAPPSADEFRLRLRRVRDVLGLLNAMPAQEPSSDLVARTMQRINSAPAGKPTVPSESVLYGLNQPLA
jgi:hypothetical protein